MSNSTKHAVIGRSVSHESAEAHVRGSANYTDDLSKRFAALLHAWPVQSNVASGRIVHIDTSAAQSVAGVVAVLSEKDVSGIANTGPVQQDEDIFPTEISFHGQAITWVIAETEEAAILGAQKVAIQVKETPAILSIEDAITKESFHTEEFEISSGESERALQEAPQQLSGEIFISGQEHFYLESQVAIASLDENGQMLVHSSTQHPDETQEIVARVLALPKSDVICHSLRMGGAFGGKEVQANLFAAIAAIASQKTGRPVRVRLDRKRDMTLTGKRHPFLGRFNVGFNKTGKLLALDVELFSDGGYSLDLSKPVLQRAMFHIDGSYRIDNLRIRGRVCKTNMTSHTAYRGFGGPQGMLVIEEILSRVAAATALDPHLVREKNLYQEGDHTHYGQKIKDAGRVLLSWDRAKKNANFTSRLAEINSFNKTQETHKRGIAITPVKFGISFTADFFNQAGALVVIYKDGSVQLNHGGTEMGQGIHTKMQQIAAQALGVPLKSVRVMATRTDKVPNASATAASSGSDLNGAAVKTACDVLQQRIAEVAGSILEESPAELVFENNCITHRNKSEKKIDFAAAVNRAYFERVQLFETGFYRTPDIHFNEKIGRGKPFHYFSYGAAVSEVLIDTFTGQYTLVRSDLVHDVGDSLSPLIDRGQIEGGFMQGVGWLTLEELVWDDKGALRTSNASTYKLPSLGECPPEFHVELLPRAADPSVIYGSKAVGEPPFMLALSVREALRHAVGGGELPVPATPEAVYWALQP